MFQGKLLAIAIARQAKGAMELVPAIEAVAGEGLRGDRYGAGIGAAQYQGRRKPENEVTLIAREAIEAANNEFNLTIEHLDKRRNLLTEGVPLNDLIGKTLCGRRGHAQGTGEVRALRLSAKAVVCLDQAGAQGPRRAAVLCRARRDDQRR